MKTIVTTGKTIERQEFKADHHYIFVDCILLECTFPRCSAEFHSSNMKKCEFVETAIHDAIESSFVGGYMEMVHFKGRFINSVYAIDKAKDVEFRFTLLVGPTIRLACDAMPEVMSHRVAITTVAHIFGLEFAQEVLADGKLLAKLLKHAVKTDDSPPREVLQEYAALRGEME